MKGSRKVRQKNKKSAAKGHKARKQILPALVAVGGACGLTAPANAIELGELQIESHLGQPLRASIAYALSPNEQLFDFCIFLRPGMAASRLPYVSNASVTVTERAIIFNGRTPLREPMLSMQVAVNCPYTAHLAREYTLLIDPPRTTPAERVLVASEQPQAPARTAPVTATQPAEPVAEAAAPVVRARQSAVPSAPTAPIATGSRYLVQPGDSLSEIVARIDGRELSLWPAVNAVFAANPDAFLNDDVNQLKAGSWLVIPDLVQGAPAVATQPAATQPVELPVQTATLTSDAATTGAVEEPDTPEAPVETDANVASQPTETAATIEDTTGAMPNTADLQPGDIVIGAGEQVVSIPDTELENPAAPPITVVSRPEVPAGSTSGAWSWLMWLGGTGVALILGLLMFRRQFPSRFGAPAAVPVPARRHDDQPQPEDEQTVEEPVVHQEVDLEFDEGNLNTQSMTLDADLDAGTGLQDNVEIDVAQDFGFTTSTAEDAEIDLELPEEPEVADTPTDVIAPNVNIEETILDSEVLPSEEEDPTGYDLSMIVDATKNVVDEHDGTAMDLKAIQVESAESAAADEYTLSNEIDYKILEQDYEDELTATQALNKEIEQAAAELAERMEDAQKTDPTAEMPAPPDPELTAELTANLEAAGDAVNEDFSEAPLDEAEITIEMEARGIGGNK